MDEIDAGVDLILDRIDPLLHKEHVLWLGLLGKGRNVALSKDELGRELAFRRRELRLDHLECFGLRLSLDNLLLLVALSLKDLGLSLGLSNVDVSLLCTL